LRIVLAADAFAAREVRSFTGGTNIVICILLMGQVRLSVATRLLRPRREGWRSVFGCSRLLVTRQGVARQGPLRMTEDDHPFAVFLAPVIAPDDDPLVGRAVS